MKKTIQWLNANHYRVYPFIEDSNMAMSPGGVALPNDAVLDFQLVTFTLTPAPVVLEKMEIVRAGGMNKGELTFRHTVDAVVTRMVVDVYENAADPYEAHLHTVNEFLSVTVGSGLTNLIRLHPPGTVFTLEEPPAVEPALIKFQPRHRVTTIVGTAEGSVPISGDVFVEEGTNVSLEIEPSNNTLRINAAPGAGKGFPLGRAVLDRPNCSEVLLLLNGLTADNLGDFAIEGFNGIVVLADPAHHLVIIRPASDPEEVTQGCGV